jgi:hypothetical protein
MSETHAMYHVCTVSEILFIGKETILHFLLESSYKGLKRETMAA